VSHPSVFVTFGTRPEAIKMAPVVLELTRRGRFDVFVCLTGQHREMLDQVVEAFALPVDHDLRIMQEKQSLGHITSAVLKGMDPLLERVKPDIVLVHGDTTTTFAAALAAYYRMIPVGHVEAGLRTDDIYSPYPEEMNRRLADRLVAVDLLDQASELLQYQIDKRLEGAARAQVAARLAMVYLTNRKPDRAIAALRSTRIADLSGELPTDAMPPASPDVLRRILVGQLRPVKTNAFLEDRVLALSVGEFLRISWRVKTKHSS